MSDRSNIEWCDATWNPIVGCSPISSGCANCYAAVQASRFAGIAGHKFEGCASAGRWAGGARLVEGSLAQPRRWRKSRIIFVCSMSDLFHEKLTDGEILRVFWAMAPWHTYIVLSKRAQRMRGWIERWNDLAGEPDELVLARGPHDTRAAHPSGRGQMFASMLESMGEPPAGCAYPTFDWMEGMQRWPAFEWSWRNVWLGVSVEDQDSVDSRLSHVAAIPGAHRWVSVEPLLGPVDLGDLRRVNQVVVGGESGPRARPCMRDWVEDVVRQCREAHVPCFVKQLGSAYADPTNGIAGAGLRVDADAAGLVSRRLRQRKGADPSEWLKCLRVRDLAWTEGERT